MYLYKFKPLIKKMEESNEVAIKFPYSYNGVNVFVIFYDLEDKLVSIIKSTNDYYTFSLNKDFSIDIKLSSDDYKKIIRMFDIKYDKEKPFNPNNFFFDFSKNIKDFGNVEKVKARSYVRYISDYLDDSFKSEFVRFVENKDGHKVSRHNLNKTAIYFGKKKQLYCKKNNISSVWKKYIKNKK